MSVKTLSGAGRSLLMCEDTRSPCFHVAVGLVLQASLLRPMHPKASCPIRNWNKLQIRRPRINCRGTNDLSIPALLDHVRAPARDSRHRKQRRKQVDGDAHLAIGNRAPVDRLELTAITR